MQSWVDFRTAVIQGLQLAVCFPEFSHPCCRFITQLLVSSGSSVGHFHTTPPLPDGMLQDPEGARTFIATLSQPSRLLRLDLCSLTHQTQIPSTEMEPVDQFSLRRDGRWGLRVKCSPKKEECQSLAAAAAALGIQMKSTRFWEPATSLQKHAAPKGLLTFTEMESEFFFFRVSPPRPVVVSKPLVVFSNKITVRNAVSLGDEKEFGDAPAWRISHYYRHFPENHGSV